MRGFKLRHLLTSAVFALSVSTSAQAADLLMDPPMEAPEIITKPAGGWYLRGDISYASHEVDEIYYGVYADPGNLHFTRADLETSFGLQGGIGYQINENFRVDATLGYKFKSTFSGSTGDGTAPCPANVALGLPNNQVAATTCISDDSTSMSAYTIMANGYFDLGNFNGFTPYVGAGIGGAYVSWDTLTNRFVCTSQGGDCNNVAGPVTHPGEDGWRFAYALHAGVSYDISHSLKLDFGYSYDRIEGGRMFGWDAGSTNGTNNKLGPQGHDRGITDHVFHAGLRYQIW